MAINIKKSKVGTLRSAMHAKEGEKLSVAAMRKKMQSSYTGPAMKKKLVFAMNARKWKHEDGGLIHYEDGGAFKWGTDTKNLQGGIGVAGMMGGALQAVGSQDSFAAQGLGGAASGAAAGMALGPVGALVGGAIGGGIGLLKAGMAGGAQHRAQQAALQARQGMVQSNQQADETENPYAPTFAFGGQVPQVPVLSDSAYMQKFKMMGDSVANRGLQLYNNLPKNVAQRDPSVLKEIDRLSKQEEGFYNQQMFFQNRLKQPMQASKFAQGGMIPQGMPNAELEKQEVTQGPDGSMETMDMPSHANATAQNQVALEPGTRIFSDKLKPVGEKKKTYADLADEIRKEMQKYEQMMYR
jgi:hypothetical protein